MPDYRQVKHGEAGFDFVNDTANDLEIGYRFKVGDLLCILKSGIPGFTAAPTALNPDNVKAWEGKAHLLLYEHARQLDVYLDAPIAVNYSFGQAVVLDGEHIGYAIPHPGPDAGDPGGGDYATPTTTSPAPIVIRATDTTIRVLAIPPIGAGGGPPVVLPKPGIIGIITPSTTDVDLQALIAAETAIQGAPLFAMSAVADTTLGDVDFDTLLGPTLPAAITSWHNGATLATKNTGPNNITYTDPVSANLLTVIPGESITVRLYGTDFRVE